MSISNAEITVPGVTITFSKTRNFEYRKFQVKMITAALNWLQSEWNDFNPCLTDIYWRHNDFNPGWKQVYTDQPVWRNGRAYDSEPREVPGLKLASRLVLRKMKPSRFSFKQRNSLLSGQVRRKCSMGRTFNTACPKNAPQSTQL